MQGHPLGHCCPVFTSRKTEKLCVQKPTPASPSRAATPISATGSPPHRRQNCVPRPARASPPASDSSTSKGLLLLSSPRPPTPPAKSTGAFLPLMNTYLSTTLCQALLQRGQTQLWKWTQLPSSKILWPFVPVTRLDPSGLGYSELRTVPSFSPAQTLTISQGRFCPSVSGTSCRRRFRASIRQKRSLMHSWLHNSDRLGRRPPGTQAALLPGLLILYSSNSRPTLSAPPCTFIFDLLSH